MAGPGVDVVHLEPELVAVEAKHSVEVLDKQVDLKRFTTRVEPPASGVKSDTPVLRCAESGARANDGRLANPRVEVLVVGEAISHHGERCKGPQGCVDARVLELGRRAVRRELIEGGVSVGWEIRFLKRLAQEGLGKLQLELVENVGRSFAFDAALCTTPQLQLNDRAVPFERDCRTRSM
jgi:hypothetical protein